MDHKAMAEHAVELGAFKAAVIGLESFTFDPAFREMCKENLCGNYGLCWTCPPDAGDISQLIAEAKTYNWGLVYQTVSKLEDSYDFEGMMEAGRLHNKLAQEIADWAAGQDFSRWLQLGAGGCHICETCAKRTNEPCRHPKLALRSLETYGVDVSKLAEASGMKYINGQDTVTYFGALLF